MTKEEDGGVGGGGGVKAEKKAEGVEKSKEEKYNELMSAMSKTKEKWDREKKNDDGYGEDGDDDEQDRLLSQAIDMAIEQGRGWSPGEKEAYLEKILDDDYIPPMFASSAEEVEKSGLQDAFTSLIYEGETPTRLMISFRKKGNDAFANGRRNEAKNSQYYRDAINFYYEALAWADRVEPMADGDLAQADTDDPTYSPAELDDVKSLVRCNVALCHSQLKNWGYARDESLKAIEWNGNNVKAWYRLAKSYEMLRRHDLAGDAIDSGLAAASASSATGKEENGNGAADLKKLQERLSSKIDKARKSRQQRERRRAERVSKVKAVWKHCRERGITLGRVPLVATASEDGDEENDDDDDDENDRIESRWHDHLPHTGRLPREISGEWSWPCVFLYPSHNQSDYVDQFGENEMIAMRMAQMFPEPDDDDDGPTATATTAIPWDHDDQFVCSRLAVYFEVHDAAGGTQKGGGGDDGPTKKKSPIHPDAVEILRDQASCMRYYESSRALKGDDGQDARDIVSAAERKRLYRRRKSWKERYGNLWANRPASLPAVRVHPAVTLLDVLKDPRMIVPGFLVTFVLFPENHPAHDAYLKEHKCLGILQPK